MTLFLMIDWHIVEKEKHYKIANFCAEMDAEV
jgi:hypothetical protein